MTFTQIYLHAAFLIVILLPKSLAVAQFGNESPVRDGVAVRMGQGVCATFQPLQTTYLASSITFLKKREWLRVRVEGSLDLLHMRNYRIGFIIGAIPLAEVTARKVAFSPFLEFGVGVNYVSNKWLGGRALGTNVLFSPTVSGGLHLHDYFVPVRIGYTFRHLSNAGIRNDNDGINFQYLTLTFGF